jgi:hypothetical protein
MPTSWHETELPGHWESAHHRAIRRNMEQDIILLLVWRKDDKPLGSEHFSVMQSAKNALVGREYYGFEVYPAESELRDRANVYWMHVCPRPNEKPDWVRPQRRSVTNGLPN